MSATDPRRSRAYAALDARAIRRFIALAGLVTVLITGAALMVSSDEDGLRVRSTTLEPALVADPLAAEFARCNGLGTAAADDTACRNAWAESRRRFLDGPAHPTKTETRASETALEPTPNRPQAGQPGRR